MDDNRTADQQQHELSADIAPAWVLRRSDQLVIAGLIVVGLLAMFISYVCRGGLQGRLVNVDEVQPQPIQFQLDMNEADWPEWSLLPGIGETLARRIVEHREARGGFSQHRDLLEVKGIGKRTLARLTPFLLPVNTTSPPQPVNAPER